MSRFAIPEIPWELVDAAKRKMRKLWALEDLDLRDPAMLLSWARSETPTQSRSACGGFFRAPVQQMIEDPEADVRAQLINVRHEIEYLEAGREVGIGLIHYPAMNLIHFGTRPLASAFGAKWVPRGDEMPGWLPAVHTPAEVMRLRKPDLSTDGICPRILERIDYYNEATQGKIPIHYADTGGAWDTATEIWHYEDMLEAIHTAPAAVHYLLNLVNECIMEWNDIQETRLWHWAGVRNPIGPWAPRGYHSAEDSLVTVSPATWEEFFLPYNNRLSRQHGGISYHCCMKYDGHFKSLAKSEGFMGLEASPDYNNADMMEAALDHKGVWCTPLGDMMKGRHGETGRRDDLPTIRQLRGKVGMILGAYGDSRQDAIDRARRLLDALEIEHQ